MKGVYETLEYNPASRIFQAYVGLNLEKSKTNSGREEAITIVNNRIRRNKPYTAPQREARYFAATKFLDEMRDSELDIEISELISDVM